MALLRRALDWPTSPTTEICDNSSKNVDNSTKNVDNSTKTDDNSTKIKESKVEEVVRAGGGAGVVSYGEVHELRLVVTGFLLNLTNSCDDITVRSVVRGRGRVKF